jgi:hypothetical protein
VVPAGAAIPSPLEDPAFVAGLRPIPSGPVTGGDAAPAHDLAGVGPGGGPVTIELAARHRPVLLVFLHVRCDGCDQFWRGLTDHPDDTHAAHATAGMPDPVDAVIVTRGPGSVDAAEVAALAEGVTRVPVVMSDRAWSDYRVTGYPFFVLVDPTGPSVIGETVGFGWADVSAMVSAALDR